ncbi:bifunctional AP-4-A phosphorylase/ADP sulfurylase [Conoideocrella luteorostrata]|uniref:Bifunctional AP-4-A phosphorylase/ADP sulfurylase n=1 Tax=Conoideocrella luteorostrata TaxID=1105319 RepID=A0AAJ0CYT5_9HYPO|nr:bifunctional AP-4-A phosphorylase/ADP sulfurylase [Conoideocrella luteorostrata]
MARAIRPPANLPELVKTVFAKAHADGELHYFASQVALIPVQSIAFQLRFSPALANKPKGPPPDPSRQKKTVDPFAHPPASLFIADVAPSHYLVLNKFAVVPEHFILATREFKEQTHVLQESDLESTLSCIEAYEQANSNTKNGGLFAFFNCGEHSGASQPHRHIQLLPIDGMRDGLEPGAPWDVLADRSDLNEAPFVVFSEPIQLGMAPSELHSAYLRLYYRACRAVDRHNGNGESTDDVPAEGPARISYNMAMTKHTLIICPRFAEGGPVYNDETEVGQLALNGTLLAGTALVKNEAEWEALTKKPSGLTDVLRRIGLSRDEADETKL